MKRLAIAVAVVFAIPSAAHSGVIRGRITDLVGNGRGAITVKYEVKGIDPNNGEEYVVQDPKTFTTSDGGALVSGQFEASWPDTYRTNTKVVVVEFVSDTPTPLAAVELRSYLGSASHAVEVVMPEAFGIETRVVEVPRASYHSPRGNFYLVDQGGVASYQSNSGLRLSALVHQATDDRFYYYRQFDQTDQRWAFARQPSHRCYCRGPRWIVDYRGFAVWRRDRHQGSWSFFGWANRIIPSNGYTSAPAQAVEQRVRESLPAPGPSDGAYREWKDQTGKHRTVAALAQVDVSNGKVYLRRRTDGMTLTVPTKQLSAEDQSFVGTAMRVQIGPTPLEGKDGTGQRARPRPSISAHRPVTSRAGRESAHR